jgi:peptidoglycan hydrolase-like protein with peptidoglycan-binding domain
MFPTIKWHVPRVLAVLATAALAVPGVAEARPLRLDDSGPKVRSLNQRLISLGYLPAGAASSRFDAATFHAVVAAQKWHRLDRDGVAGSRTLATLAGSTRPAAGPGGRARRIDVLLDRQVVLLIEGGQVRRTISVSTGAPGFDTPRGTFRVGRKELRSWSVPYAVWLPYASYFNGGIAFHEGESVPAHPASHGCVRIPKPFAAEVYAFATTGTQVRVI